MYCIIKVSYDRKVKDRINLSIKVFLMRMDKYGDTEDKIKENDLSNFSRVDRNQKVYQDIYMNNSYVSIDDLLDDATENVLEEDNQIEEKDYEEKNYNIDDYLSKARERLKPDEEKRNLDDEFRKQEDEISKLIEDIDKKNREDDFFEELLADDDSDTLIEGQVHKEEVLEITSYEEYSFDTNTNQVQLNKVLGNETIANLEIDELNSNEGFSDVVKGGYSKKKRRIIAIVFFVISFLLLVGVIVFIVLPRVL